MRAAADRRRSAQIHAFKVEPRRVVSKTISRGGAAARRQGLIRLLDRLEAGEFEPCAEQQSATSNPFTDTLLPAPWTGSKFFICSFRLPT